ncbi:MAG TPA: MBL fold metallo-hydrolase [Thermoleophilia bacterium]|nr:MBL fold metallo-hydrolase [Thermoleophilia bacterium]
MRLTMLGTQGWIPTPRRETTCITVEDGDRLFIFDAGTGLGRLVEAPGSAMLERASEFHLFLTHYHLDHVCGLAYLPALFADRELTIHAPEASINGVDIEKGIGELIRHPYNPGAFDLAGLTLHSLKEGANTVAGHEVRVRRQCHPDITVGYRLDDAFVLATDTVYDPGTAEFARGVGLLLHEAWIDGVEEHMRGKEALVARAYKAHSSARQAAKLAAAAAVGELFLIHLNPLMDEAYYQQQQAAARETFSRTSVVPDLYWREL